MSRRADRQQGRTGGPTRLWTRLTIRILALALLLLGLAGGYLLSDQRQVQRQNAAASQSAMTEAQEIRALKLERTRQWVEGAPQRAAQADAQAKANDAAKAAADQARAADEAARKSQAASRSQDRTTTTPGVPVPTSCAQYSGNQGTGCALLLQWGFGLDQMPCLVSMWNKESGWRTTAKNSSSGAYGIPQALPASKMAAYGSDYLTNPVPQIKWGLDYIKNRYSTPCGAWSFWQAHGFY